jgi:hypothetical protein
VYVSFPELVDPHCREGKAKIFDECGDQSALFSAALARAKGEGKVLLVEYGAEWCIWCHVFDAHINGEHDRFRYTYGTPEEPEARYTRTLEEPPGADTSAADSLRAFVAANFVIAHIDSAYAPNGEAVLEASGASAHFPGSIPFVFTVDASGRFAASFHHESAEKRRDTDNWYRGYDRAELMRQLTKMRDAARPSPAAVRQSIIQLRPIRESRLATDAIQFGQPRHFFLPGGACSRIARNRVADGGKLSGSGRVRAWTGK